MKLAATALDEFWDGEDELALLGPWCLRGRKDPRLDGRRWRMLPNVWDDRALLRSSAAECSRAYEAMIGRLAARLDELHGAPRGERYWDVLAGSWLVFYVHQLYDRWTQIKAARALHPDAESAVLDPRDFRVPFDSEDYSLLFQTPRYDLQLYSQALVFEGAKVRTVRAELAEPPRPAPPSLSPRRLLRDALRTVCDRAVRAGLAGVATDEMYPSGALLWSIVRACGFRALPVRPPYPASLRTPPRFDERRLGLTTLEARTPFEKLLVSTLPYALPTAYLEGFAAARETCAGPYRRAPSVLFAGVSLYYDDAMKFLAAEWVARGAKLLGFQHGGQYGTAAFTLAEEHERRISDRFYVWGWAGSDPKLGNLPVPKFSKSVEERPFPLDVNARDILVVCAEGLKNAHHLFPTPMGSQWERYAGRREEFLAALGPLRAASRVRLSPQDYGWDQRGRLLERFPDQRLDDASTPFAASVESARLVVADHPGTTMLELLATNRPSIHFWDADLWETRESARPALDRLRAAGIVHDSPASAAAHAARVHGDVEAWWRSAEVQEARRYFCERYAATDPDWPRAWAAVLVGS